MPRRSSSMCLLLLCVGAISTSWAGTNVSGIITTTTWTAAHSPYHITNTVTVPPGNVLTIEPGVDILFDADVPFVVEGAIHAVRTEADSIRFVKGTAPRWRGLRLYSTDGDTCTLHYVRFSDGYTEAPDYPYPENYGGGLCLGKWDDDAPPEHLRGGLAHVVASGNYAKAQGGGIALINARVTMDGCTVRNNTVSPCI